MIFQAEWVVPISQQPIRQGAVRVVDGQIAEVGLASELRRDHPDEEARNFEAAVLLPGFVNAHVHLEYSVFRGLFDDCSFGDWMMRFMRAKRKLGESE